MTDHRDHDHHSHAHSQGPHHGMHGHVASGGGLMDAVLGNAQGLASLSHKLGSGQKFWIGAAIGAVVATVVSSPETRSALGSMFRGSSTTPAHPPQTADSADTPSSN